MPPILSLLIAENYATLKELQQYYIYEDCLDMMDILMTKHYNQFIISENNRNKNGK